MKIEAKQVTVEGHVIYKLWWKGMDCYPYESHDLSGKYWFDRDVIFNRADIWLLKENETSS